MLNKVHGFDHSIFTLDACCLSQVFVLSGADEVLEALEDHQMQLQGMAGMGKFVDFFRQEVHEIRTHSCYVCTSV